MSSAQNGTYDLHISFMGLCLSAIVDETLEVIMPEAKDHRVAIVFEGRYAGDIGTPYIAVPADDCHIDLTPLTPGGVPDPHIPPEILNLKGLGKTGNLCDRCKPDGSLADQVNSLVTLQSGCATGIGLPKQWYVQGVPMRLTHCLEWCISDIDDSSLALSTFGAPANMPALQPIDSLSGPEIHLQIVCLPAELICQYPDAPAQLPTGTPAPHFPMFACLFDKWDPTIIPTSTAPGTVSPYTLSAQDCISAGWGGGG